MQKCPLLYRLCLDSFCSLLFWSLCSGTVLLSLTVSLLKIRFRFTVCEWWNQRITNFSLFLYSTTSSLFITHTQTFAPTVSYMYTLHFCFILLTLMRAIPFSLDPTDCRFHSHHSVSDNTVLLLLLSLLFVSSCHGVTRLLQWWSPSPSLCLCLALGWIGIPSVWTGR